MSDRVETTSDPASRLRSIYEDSVGFDTRELANRGEIIVDLEISSGIKRVSFRHVYVYIIMYSHECPSFVNVNSIELSTIA